MYTCYMNEIVSVFLKAGSHVATHGFVLVNGMEEQTRGRKGNAKQPQ